jgi:hypothetical protein
VVVDGDDLADGAVLGLGDGADVVELVGVFVGDLAAGDVDGDDAHGAGVGAAVLQRALHDADQGLAVGVMARPSMPLLATRPLVLAAISVAPWADRVLTANFSGRVITPMRLPVALSNW